MLILILVIGKETNLVPNYRVIFNNLNFVPEMFDENLSENRLMNLIDVTKFNLTQNITKNGHILVCPPTPAIKEFLKCKNWLKKTLEQIYATGIKREIRIREKPKEVEVHLSCDKHIVPLHGKPIKSPSSLKPLSEDLKNCHCMITFNSNSVVEALTSGVPVITTPYSSAYMLSTSIENIFKPVYPSERLIMKWLTNLAWNQFNMNEIKSGFLWETLSKRGIYSC